MFSPMELHWCDKLGPFSLLWDTLTGTAEKIKLGAGSAPPLSWGWVARRGLTLSVSALAHTFIWGRASKCKGPTWTKEDSIPHFTSFPTGNRNSLRCLQGQAHKMCPALLWLVKAVMFRDPILKNLFIFHKKIHITTYLYQLNRRYLDFLSAWFLAFFLNVLPC